MFHISCYESIIPPPIPHTTPNLSNKRQGDLSKYKPSRCRNIMNNRTGNYVLEKREVLIKSQLTKWMVARQPPSAANIQEPWNIPQSLISLSAYVTFHFNIHSHIHIHTHLITCKTDGFFLGESEQTKTSLYSDICLHFNKITEFPLAHSMKKPRHLISTPIYKELLTNYLVF